jgi:hypothetical protein
MTSKTRLSDNLKVKLSITSRKEKNYIKILVINILFDFGFDCWYSAVWNILLISWQIVVKRSLAVYGKFGGYVFLCFCAISLFQFMNLFNFEP